MTTKKIDAELDNIENSLLKKKVPVKKKTPKEIEMQKIVNIVAPKVPIKSPEFKEIVTTDVKYRINWLGILRKINVFGKKTKIIKEEKPRISLWKRYSDWWNKHFNKQTKKKVIKKKPTRKVIVHGKKI